MKAAKLSLSEETQRKNPSLRRSTNFPTAATANATNTRTIADTSNSVANLHSTRSSRVSNELYGPLIGYRDTVIDEEPNEQEEKDGEEEHEPVITVPPKRRRGRPASSAVKAKSRSRTKTAKKTSTSKDNHINEIIEEEEEEEDGDIQVIEQSKPTTVGSRTLPWSTPEPPKTQSRIKKTTTSATKRNSKSSAKPMFRVVSKSQQDDVMVCVV